MRPREGESDVRDPRRSILVEMARWDETAKVISVPVVLDDQRTLGCTITYAAIHAVLERLMQPDEYVAALRRHSAAILAVAHAKVAAGAIMPEDRIAIDWQDVATARWHI